MWIFKGLRSVFWLAILAAAWALILPLLALLAIGGATGLFDDEKDRWT